MRIEWLPAAEDSLGAQLDWIAEQDPWAAIDMGDAILAAVSRLADFPAIARQGRVDGTRELFVVGTPYIVVYQIESSAVVILRVLHGAQRWPAT
ncbi:MAG: type II toxin-antitoxin system RelE/ParE family toxin [Actinobacteria bacterium]|nr:type II toxin-antitoxin system RelE/ParE family toxin [Actinomycetota bacterium]